MQHFLFPELKLSLYWLFYSFPPSSFLPYSHIISWRHTHELTRHGNPGGHLPLGRHSGHLFDVLPMGFPYDAANHRSQAPPWLNRSLRILGYIYVVCLSLHDVGNG